MSRLCYCIVKKTNELSTVYRKKLSIDETNCENNKFLFVKVTFWLLFNTCLVKIYMFFVLFLLISFMFTFFFLRKQIFDCYLMPKWLNFYYFFLFKCLLFRFSCHRLHFQRTDFWCQRDLVNCNSLTNLVCGCGPGRGAWGDWVGEAGRAWGLWYLGLSDFQGLLSGLNSRGHPSLGYLYAQILNFSWY